MRWDFYVWGSACRTVGENQLCGRSAQKKFCVFNGEHGTKTGCCEHMEIILIYFLTLSFAVGNCMPIICSLLFTTFSLFQLFVDNFSETFALRCLKPFLSSVSEFLSFVSNFSFPVLCLLLETLESKSLTEIIYRS